MSMMQIIWLMLTIFARHALYLPLTQLELATFAFSIFAVATYAVNWWKPKDVSKPTYISGFSSSSIALDQTQSFVSRLIYSGKAEYDTSKLGMGVHVARVKNDVVDLEGRLPLIFRLMAAAAFVFGGIHCLAWNFVFPSHPEAVLWRIASIGSAVIPIIQLGISILFNSLGTSATNSKLKFLLKELDQLGKIPSCYFDRLEQATFAGCLSDSNPNCVKSSGTCDFLHAMSREDLAGMRQTESDGISTLTCAKYALKHLRHFLWLWRYVQTRKTSPETVRLFESALFGISKVCSKPGEKLFVHYENVHIKPGVISIKPGYRELPDMTVVQYPMDNARPAFEEEYERGKKIEEMYQTASRFSTIICSIFYVSVRLIIIVLLFTSLREVPIGVYTESPWTRYLPNFS